MKPNNKTEPVFNVPTLQGHKKPEFTLSHLRQNITSPNYIQLEEQIELSEGDNISRSSKILPKSKSVVTVVDVKTEPKKRCGSFIVDWLINLYEVSLKIVSSMPFMYMIGVPIATVCIYFACYYLTFVFYINIRSLIGYQEL